MRRPLIQWGKALRLVSPEEFEERHGRAFLVTDPASVFNVPDGPISTQRIDLNLYRASQEGTFHEATPVFSLQRREESVYSFISIGRTENCDVPLRDESVSKLHALIRARDGAFSNLFKRLDLDSRMLLGDPVSHLRHSLSFKGKVAFFKFRQIRQTDH